MQDAPTSRLSNISAPERRRYTLELVLEANRPNRPALPPSASIVQGRRLMLVIVTVDGKQNVLR
jgi:hypothetical protein